MGKMAGPRRELAPPGAEQILRALNPDCWLLGCGHHPAGGLWKSPDRKYRRRSGNVAARRSWKRAGCGIRKLSFRRVNRATKKRAGGSA